MGEDEVPGHYLDRELSEVAYHARVLDLAADPDRPLLARARFLAILAGNLDEFFRIRVAGLKEQVVAGVTAASPGGLAPVEQLARITEHIRELACEQARVFLTEVCPGLRTQGAAMVSWDELSRPEHDALRAYFEERIFPVLTPLAVDPAHPFPFISDLSLNLAVLVHDPQGPRTRFSRVKVPGMLGRFVPVPGAEGRFVPLEQVVGAHVDRLFPGLEVVAHHPFRVTRNADYDVEEQEAADLLDAIESELLQRRFGRVVRMETTPGMHPDIRRRLMRQLELHPDDVYEVEGLLGMVELWDLDGLDRPDLDEPAWEPVDVPGLGPTAEEMFAAVRRSDVLMHHPYDSFASSTQRLIEEAADDPQVLAIKQTLYRTSPDSPIAHALVRAVESGKQAVALLELKARFDERANIRWARQLEEAGVHVTYGLVGLKTHTKISLIVRREEGGIRRYGHVGTGNYNPRTARVYEDVGLLTSDSAITAELSELFNFLTGHSRQDHFRSLVVAPMTLRERIIDLITKEARPGGRIRLKLNNLVDTEVIDALYAAAQAGAEIDLIVRSICCLRPGAEGLSERIRVRSIVGTFLEHSRIYRFGEDPAPGCYLIGSADLMPRTLDRRVEAVVPVQEPELRQRLDEILAVCFADDTLAWELHPDGSWTRKQGGGADGTHTRLAELAEERRRRGTRAAVIGDPARLLPPAMPADAEPAQR